MHAARSACGVRNLVLCRSSTGTHAAPHVSSVTLNIWSTASRKNRPAVTWRYRDDMSSDAKGPFVADYEAATAAVRDLFGGACTDPPPLGITLTPSVCGTCPSCVRDWSPEAAMIVNAALSKSRSEEHFCPNEACCNEKGHAGRCDERAALP